MLDSCHSWTKALDNGFSIDSIYLDFMKARYAWTHITVATYARSSAFTGRISNTALYRRCRCHPISEDVKSARWRLFGHVLRMPRDTPAQQAIDYYFAGTGDDTFRGRPRTSLPTALSADLRRVGRTLRRPADIDALRLLNREQWRQLERDIAEEP